MWGEADACGSRSPGKKSAHARKYAWTSVRAHTNTQQKERKKRKERRTPTRPS